MSSPGDKNTGAAIFGYSNGFGYGTSGFGYGIAPQGMGIQQQMSPMAYLPQPHLHHPGPYRPMNHHPHPHSQLPPQQSQSPQPSQSPTPQQQQSPVQQQQQQQNNNNNNNNNMNAQKSVKGTTTTTKEGAVAAGGDEAGKGNTNTAAATDASASGNDTNTNEADPEGHVEGETEEGGEGDPEEEEVSIKILVPNNMVGSIIGKGGATIKDITVQTKAKIHIAQGDDNSLERVVTITGTLPSVSQAQFQISLKMQEESFSEIKEYESEVPAGKRMCLIPMKLLVPNAVVGRLIGKGGANLKKTMAETDTFIICSKEDEITRFTGDRIVSVVGNVENQTKAQTSVTQQVKLYLQSQAPTAPMLSPKDKGPVHYDQPFVSMMRGAPPRGMESFSYPPFPRAVPIPAAAYHHHHHQALPVPFRVAPELSDHEETVVVQVPNGVVGSIIGKGGATIKDIASRSRTTIRVARNDEVDANAANRAVTISGTLESLFKAQSMIFAKIAEAPPAIGGGGDQPFRVELTIPNEMVGRIIGKKGSQVKKITEVSGARLTINQEEPSSTGEDGGSEQSNNTIVTVSGRLDSNLLAQHLIQEILFYHQTPQE